MKLDVTEMMKLLDFLLENREIVISDDSLFTVDLLRNIRMISKQKIPNNFILTDKQKELLINIFLNKKLTFNFDTPSFILKNEKCMKCAIKQDINSIDYLDEVNEKYMRFIEKECIRQRYIINHNSQNFIIEKYNIVKNSIKLDVFSSNYINWDLLETEEINELLQIILNSKYYVSELTPNYLLNNKSIILLSINNNSNIKMNLIPAKLKQDIEIIECLILNNYKVEEKYLDNLTLKSLCNESILDFILNKFDYYPENMDNDIKKNFRSLILSCLNSKPKIIDFKNIFSIIAEIEWKQTKQKRSNEYRNIFGKICSVLREKETFDAALKELFMLNDMSRKLGNDYNLLYDAMINYYNIYHNDYNNRLDKIKIHQDIISKYSSKYISKCKEHFIKDRYIELILPYFKIKLDNPIIIKKFLLEKQREKFAELFNNNDENTKKFVSSIIKKYTTDYDQSLVESMIIPFITNDKKKMFTNYMPEKYTAYLMYEKIKRLIKRLNLGYIKLDDNEVRNYLEFIIYNQHLKQYEYNGNTFNDNELEEFNEYKNKLLLFKKIQKEFIFKIKKVKITETLTYDDIKRYSLKLDFNDENYEFDLDEVLLNKYNILNHCIFSNSIGYQYNNEVFEDKNVYKYVYNLLVSSGLSWLLILLRNHPFGKDFNRCGLSSFKIFNLINGMKKLISMSTKFKIDILDFSNLLKFSQMINYLNDEIISILNPDLIVKLCYHRSFIERDETEILSMAVDLICNMRKKSRSTVPYIEGEYLNYKYSMYDSLNEDILESGLDTDSCFRIGGTDNDFMHYCAINKNGFIIKITDLDNNLVARASGFRNGNAVYINQLRTVFDMGNIKASSKLCNDKEGIIKVFNKACFDIISISQNNEAEKDKINFIFVTKGYLLDHVSNNVSDEVVDFIGECPVDNISSNWKEYIQTTPNLDFDNSFTTDYGTSSVICVISSKNIEDIKVSDFKHGDVPALYKRKRSKIRVYKELNLEILSKIRKIKAISYHLNKTIFNYINIPDDATILSGDNWYIVLHNNNIIDDCVIDDGVSIKEYQSAIEVLKDNSILLEEKILSLTKKNNNKN